MPIYTKVGDEGSSRLPGGQMHRKSEPLPEALGSVDELNCHLGLCMQCAGAAGQSEIPDVLSPIQRELFAIGASLAGAAADKAQTGDNAVARMEKQIDDAWAKMPPLEHFILPGGSELACRLHVARAVCRRAERAIVAACDKGLPVSPGILKYINRLSDLLFTMARLANFSAGVAEVQWRG